MLSGVLCFRGVFNKRELVVCGGLIAQQRLDAL